MIAGVGVLAAVGRVGVFAADVARLAATRPRFLHECAQHTVETAVRGFLPAVLIVAAFGAVVALQGLEIFKIFGTEAMLPSLVVVAILREAAPTFAGIMMAAQAGSSVAAELAVMKVKEEIDATEVMSVDAMRFHVLPRVVALLLAAPLLTTLAGAAGIASAWVVTVKLAGVGSGTFRENMFGFITGADIVASMAKAVLYGLMIGIVATYQGVNAGRGARGVGEAANRAVVVAIVCIVVANYILTSALFGAVG